MAKSVKPSAPALVLPQATASIYPEESPRLTCRLLVNYIIDSYLLMFYKGHKRICYKFFDKNGQLDGWPTTWASAC